MVRVLFATLVVVVLFAGSLMAMVGSLTYYVLQANPASKGAAAGVAAAGVVVSYDNETMKLVVKVGDQEKTYELNAKSHIHDSDGKHLKVEDRPAKFKKDTKIEIEEKDGKVTGINIKK